MSQTDKPHKNVGAYFGLDAYYEFHSIYSSQFRFHHTHDSESHQTIVSPMGLVAQNAARAPRVARGGSWARRPTRIPKYYTSDRWSNGRTPHC
jgi:hypothetical protein